MSTGEPHDFRAKMAREGQAELERCVRLRGEGRESEARDAYLWLVTLGDPAPIAEARRLAGLETPAEYGFRLARSGDLAAAADELRRAYTPSTAAVEFGMALFAGDDAAARAVEFGGDLEMTFAARIAMDLAFLHARSGDPARMRALVVLANDHDFGTAGWAYALDCGSAHPAEVVAEVGRELAELLYPYGDDTPAWCREAFWGAIADLGDAQAAAQAMLRLGDLLSELGDADGARAAYSCVAELGGSEASEWANLELARLRSEFGDPDRAFEVYEEIAESAPGEAGAAARAVVQTVASEGWEAVDHHHHGSGADACATARYADLLATAGYEGQARDLHLKIAEV